MNFNKKTILAYSDPAGFNIICALVDEFIAQKKVCNKDFKVFTNLEGIIDKKYSPYISIIKNKIDRVENEIDKFQPEKIFTATSLNIFEHLWRVCSKKKNIRVESFVDHWTGIKKRFIFSNKLVYPDAIFVINGMAKKIAIEEGIPEKIIFIRTNPYYKKVENFIPEVSESIFLNDLEIKPKHKIILYVSDNIKDTPIFKDLGFDELSIFENLMESLYFLEESKKINVNNFFIIIKLHPREKEKKYLDLIKKREYKNIKLVKFYDPLVINYYSDLVIGSFSNMIIESYLLKKSLLRVQIGIRKEDPLKFGPLTDKFISNSTLLNLELERSLLLYSYTKKSL